MAGGKKSSAIGRHTLLAYIAMLRGRVETLQIELGRPGDDPDGVLADTNLTINEPLDLSVLNGRVYMEPSVIDCPALEQAGRRRHA